MLESVTTLTSAEARTRPGSSARQVETRHVSRDWLSHPFEKIKRPNTMSVCRESGICRHWGEPFLEILQSRDSRR